MKAFADRLRQIQKERDLTQVQLANILKITPSTLSSYINDRKNPQLDSVAKFAKELGVTVGWLCGDDVEAKRPETYVEVIKAIDWLLSLNRTFFRVGINFDNGCIHIKLNDSKLLSYYLHVGELENMGNLDDDLRQTVIEALRERTFSNDSLPDRD